MSQNLILTLGYIIVVFGAMYFLWIAPQNRQRKAQAAMMEALAPGDEVVTTGGLIGTIQAVEGDRIELEISEDVVVRVVRQAVAARVTEATPGQAAVPSAGPR